MKVMIQSYFYGLFPISWQSPIDLCDIILSLVEVGLQYLQRLDLRFFSALAVGKIVVFVQ